MLACPINLEVYQYEIGNKIIALDVQSSSFFSIEQLTSDILELTSEYLTKDIIKLLKSDYAEEKIKDKLNYLEDLWESGELNTYDRFNGAFYNFARYELKLHPTSNCNLDCQYCFGDQVHEEEIAEISLETAKDAIDFLVHEFGADGREYHVDLTGSGEAILRFDFIKEIKDYCNQLSQEIDKRILVSLCSNGTLLTQEKSSYLKQNNILYGVSLDGGQVINDDLRPYRGGQGSFVDVIENCKQIKNRDLLGFAVTLTGEYTNVKDIFLDLYQLNLADTIGIKPIRLPADNKYAINESNIDDVKEGYNDLALFILSETIKGNT
ncbi:MAG: radical SAM protein, partial [Bacillota bacterium]